MIDFKTYEEQIEIIKKRGLLIEDEQYAKQQLALYNYYNIINAYKDLFVINNGTEQEKFIDGVKFEELMRLYTFDSCLKEMVLEQILRIESILKSTIAYVFAKNHTDGDYLNKNNFNVNFVEKRKTDGSIIFDTDKVINELGDCLSEQIDKKSKMICHYQQKYNRVPIWVFVNVLTLGLVSKLYAIMQQHDQVEVCKQISYLLGIELFPYDLTKYLVNLVYIRNLCAHNQRLYDLKTNMQLSTKSKFMKELGLSKQPKGIFLLLIIIRNLSRKEEFNSFFLKFIENINYLREGISSIDTEGIIKKMGLIEKDKWFKLYLP